VRAEALTPALSPREREKSGRCPLAGSEGENRTMPAGREREKSGQSPLPEGEG